MQVTIRKLNVSFSGRPIFQDADFDFHAGEMTAIMGPSGAGKSTLLSIIGRFVRPNSGVVTLGEDAGVIAWINQENRLILGRSAVDNVALGGISIGLSNGEARSQAAEILTELGLADLSRTRAKHLSGGEMQRLAIGRALASKPDLLLADEPTASLDGASRERVIAALRAGLNRGATVIIATHDAAAAAMCDQVIHIDS